MSSEKTPQGVPQTELFKENRLLRAFETLSKMPPAENAKEAFVQVSEALSSVEDRLPERIVWADRMTAGPFDLMESLRFKELTIYYKIYTKHLLLIGENGAIEILSTSDAALPEDRKAVIADLGEPPFPNLPQVFLKRDANGRGPLD